MADSTGPSEARLERLKTGDEQALASLFSEHRNRLRRLVEFRMDARLAGRLDPEDILQEAYLDAVKRSHHFAGDTEQSCFIWMRLVVLQTLIDTHRRHLGAQMRSVGREVSLAGPTHSQATSASLTAVLLGNFTSPTLAARRVELSNRLRETLETMDPVDREVLALRHFEELGNSEVAEELGIQQKAASIRYVRALRRLRDILGSNPELMGVFRGDA